MKTYDLKELSTATSKMPKTGGEFTGAVTSNSNVTTTGTVTANKLVKSGGTSSQLLLANGDSKATSDFATSGHNHDNTYLKLAGGTLTGVVSSNSNITSSANLTGAKIIKSGGTNAQLLLANGDSKATSDFATSGHNHDNTYLKLSGGTLTGAVSSNSNVTTTGTLTANKLVKSSGTSSQILLANGDTKATSDFATSGHKHDGDYLKLSGGTLTGAVSSNSNITTTGNVTGAKIIKSNGTSSQLLLANGDIKATGDFATSVHTHKAWKRVWKKEVTEEQSAYWTYIYVNPELELAYFVAEVDNIRLSNGHRHIIASESTSSSLKKAMFPIDTLFITARIDGSVRIGFYGVQINSNGEGVSGFGSNVEYTIQFYDSNNTEGTSSQSGYASAVYKPQGTYQQLNDLPEV